MIDVDPIRTYKGEFFDLLKLKYNIYVLRQRLFKNIYIVNKFNILFEIGNKIFSYIYENKILHEIGLLQKNIDKRVKEIKVDRYLDTNINSDLVDKIHLYMNGYKNLDHYYLALYKKIIKYKSITPSSSFINFILISDGSAGLRYST